MASDYPSHVQAITPFSWFGGKTMDLQFVLPLLEVPHQTYVEPFGGSAAVLLHKPQSPVEVYNDVDERLVNFFCVLRDSPCRLVNQLRRTPYARREFERAIEARGDESEADNLEQARKFFVGVQQAHSAKPSATKGAWGYNVEQSRRGRAGAVNNWQGKIDSLLDVADRMREVQIESKPALDVLERYDHDDALHYLDPPYLHEAREQNSTDVYDGEMTRGEHREMCGVVRGLEGKVAVSGYPNALYEEELEAYGWERRESEASSNTADAGQRGRVECVWTNYDPDVVQGGQMEFGDF